VFARFSFKCCSGSIRHKYLLYTLTLFAIYIRFNSPYISVLHSYFIRHIYQVQFAIYICFTLLLYSPYISVLHSYFIRHIYQVQFAIYICFTLLLYSPYISGSIRHIYLFHSYIPQCSLLYFKTHHKCQTCVLTRNMS
jgi:hypothetical protein